jgi:CRP-like cAMP-binding protein
MLEDAPSEGLGARLLALRRFPLLMALPGPDLKLLARACHERDHEAGQTLAIEGTTADKVRLLLAGRVRLSRAGAEGKPAGPLAVIGLLPTAASVPHAVTAVADTAVHALEIEASLFADVLDDNFDLFTSTLRMGAADALAGASGAISGRASLDTEFAMPDHLDLVDRLLILRRATLFRAAPIDGLASFAKRMTVRRVAAGESLDVAGPDGRLVIRHDDGHVLGALEALADNGLPLRQVAQRCALYLCGTVGDLLDVIEDHHGLGRSLLAALMKGR